MLIEECCIIVIQEFTCYCQEHNGYLITNETARIFITIYIAPIIISQ